MRDIQALADGLKDGQRRALAKAITLVESTRLADKKLAQSLLAEAGEVPGHTLRLGISGLPGAGKSTLIEALGMYLIGQGKRVAVLSVDPSSSRTGGAILGDKTRMVALASHAHAYIRPSPSGGQLGGVADHTWESIQLCELAGFDIIMIETVGVGQSEDLAAHVCDVFLLLQLAQGGDELQAIKKGVLDWVDLLLINKSDLDPELSKQAARHYQLALHLARPRYENWRPSVHTLSAKTNSGIAELWQDIQSFMTNTKASGEWQAKRQSQLSYWFKQKTQTLLLQWYGQQPTVKQLAKHLSVGAITPNQALEQFIRFARLDEELP